MVKMALFSHLMRKQKSRCFICLAPEPALTSEKAEWPGKIQSLKPDSLHLDPIPVTY